MEKKLKIMNKYECIKFSREFFEINLKHNKTSNIIHIIYERFHSLSVCIKFLIAKVNHYPNRWDSFMLKEFNL